MVLHGATDPRVPTAETERMVEPLHELEMIVEDIRVEDEGHGFIEPANRLMAYPVIADILTPRMPPYQLRPD